MDINFLKSLFLRGFRPYAWLILVCLALYSPCVMLDFVCYDDNVLISENQEFLKNPANIKAVFTQHYFAAESPAGRYYRPLVTLSYMTDTWLGKGAAWAYHATNVAIFILSCLLLFLFLKQIQNALQHPSDPAIPPNGWLPFLGAMLYAVHPLQAMAIAWIPGRNDTLLACFFLPSMWCFIRYRLTRKLTQLGCHLALFVLALLCKETAVLIPVLCLAWVWLIEGNRNWKKWFDETPLFLWMGIGLGWFLLRGYALGLFMAGNPEGGVPWLSQAGNLTGLITRYYGKMAFPVHLALIPDMAETPVIYGLIFLILTFIVFWRLKGLPLRFMAFGLAWALGVLVLSVPFSKAYEIRNVGLLEHRMVLAWAGILTAWMAAATLLKWSPSRIWLGLSSASLLLLSFLSVQRLPDFIDPRCFWAKAIIESPESSDAWHNYGSVLTYDLRYEASEKAYREALRLDPQRPLTHLNLAFIYTQQNRRSEAIDECYRELDNTPFSEKACLTLSILYYEVGNPRMAQGWKEREQKIRAGQFVLPFKRNR